MCRCLCGALVGMACEEKAAPHWRPAFPEAPRQRWGRHPHRPSQPCSDSSDNGAPWFIASVECGKRAAFFRLCHYPSLSQFQQGFWGLEGCCYLIGVLLFSFRNGSALISIYAVLSVCPEHREYPEDTIPVLAEGIFKGATFLRNH